MRQNTGNMSTLTTDTESTTESKAKGPSRFAIPFALAITLQIFLISTVITAALLLVSTTSTASSNALCIDSSVTAISNLSSSLQQRTADLVALRLNDTVTGAMDAIAESSRLHRTRLLDVAAYDRLWPYFFEQIRELEAVSLVYFGDATTKDFVGVRRILGSERAQYGVDLMNRADVSRCPQTCPASMSSNKDLRYKFYLDPSGTLTGDAYESAPFDVYERQWYKDATATNSSLPIWTSPYVFSNQKDIGVTAAVRIANASDPSRLQGVLAADMSFAVLKTHLTTLPLTPNGLALVFDSNGNLFGSSVPDEGVTTLSASGTAVLKSVRQLADPRSLFAMDQILKRLPTPNDFTSLPQRTSFRVPLPTELVPAGVSSTDLMLHLQRVEMGHGLRLWTLIAAPLGDYTGGIEQTSVELRERLANNTKLMVGIGAGVVLAFVILWFPITIFTIGRPLRSLAKHMEEIARFDFGSLRGKERNQRSFIKEIGMMQTAYWQMILKFANGIRENRAVMANGKSTGGGAAHVTSHHEYGGVTSGLGHGHHAKDKNDW
ncbi:hypothetical protein HDU96_002114 [Phlyctochytrium bullatum]|nr:hypothetical protein HDU96_002114 [Phlyctochytrium bullatum]